MNPCEQSVSQHAEVFEGVGVGKRSGGVSSGWSKTELWSRSVNFSNELLFVLGPGEGGSTPPGPEAPSLHIPEGS